MIDMSEVIIKEADKIATGKTDEEVLCEGIRAIVGGTIVLYQISVGGPVNCSYDPAMDVALGERLVELAIQRLKEREPC